MEWGTPVEPVGILSLFSSGLDVCPGSQFLVHTAVASELDGVVDPAAVNGVDDIVHPIPVTERYAVLKRDASRPAVAGYFPRIMALKTAVNVIRVVHVHSDGIVLGHGKVVVIIACLPPVVGNIDTAVTPHENAV